MIFTVMHGALSNLFHSHNTTLTSCRAQGKPGFIFLIIHRQMLKRNSNSLPNSLSIYNRTGCQKPFCYRGVSPSLLFQHASPFYSPFYFRSSFFPSSSCFPGLCRDIHHGGLRLLLNFTVFPLYSNVLTLVFAS